VAPEKAAGAGMACVVRRGPRRPLMMVLDEPTNHLA